MAEERAKGPVSLITEEVKAAGLQVKPTINNFYRLITNHYGENLRLNVMTGKPEYRNAHTHAWTEWTDTEESRMRAYFESTYSMYSQNKMTDALMVYFQNHRVNPLLEILESLEWDGKPRMEQFLHDVMKAGDTDYTRECSRLIFAGGIHRAYRPGCKFDDMIVLIGSQGAGKSTIVRWLNMEDEFFREIKTISGKEGIEAIRGVWIGEVSELIAMTRVREAEAVKAYITSREDNYRPPYQKNIVTIPRRCVFIGTTNNEQFLTDRTGNRRFYPVKCESNAYRLYENEELIRGYIRQAWAEAVHLFREGRLQPFAKEEVQDEIRRAQEAAMEDDWRIGAIRLYLDTLKTQPDSAVSVIELWHRALGVPEESKPARRDSIEISQIMSSMDGWVQSKKLMYTPWGRQRVYCRDIFH